MSLVGVAEGPGAEVSPALEPVGRDVAEPAFADLYDLTASRMWRLALALTHDTQRAEYVLEQVYVAAWAHLRATSSPVTASAFCRLLVETARARCAPGPGHGGGPGGTTAG